MKRKNVLIVEDDGNVLDILKDLAKDTPKIDSANDNIFLASDGQEAKNILDKIEIDALITDLRMPIMDGVDLVNELKQVQNREFPIFIISGFITPELMDSYKDREDVKFFKKPFDICRAFEELDVALGEVITYRRVS